MRGWITAVIGSASVGLGGLVWAGASFQAGAMVETIWCATFGLGFLILLASLLRPLPRLTAPLGLLVSAAPAFYWAQSVAAFGAYDSPWFLFGLGVCAAAAATIAFTLVGRELLVRWSLRIGLGAALLATAIMILQALSSPSPWLIAEVLVLVGLIGLVASARFITVATGT